VVDYIGSVCGFGYGICGVVVGAESGTAQPGLDARQAGLCSLVVGLSPQVPGDNEAITSGPNRLYAPVDATVE